MIKSKKEAETLRELTEKHPIFTFTFNLYYDVWERPGSYSKRQEVVKNISAKELSEKYGDFKFEGWYTLSVNPNVADIWAEAVGDRRFDYPSKGEIMDNNINWKKVYEDGEVSTFELENEVDNICRKMQEEGASPELIGRVSELGYNAAQTQLEYQALDIAVEQVCDGRELGKIGEGRRSLEQSYRTRALSEEALDRLESYAPGFIEKCPDAVLLEDGDIENYFAHDLRLWCLDKNGEMWAPKEPSDALAFIAEGGLVVTSAFMFEKELNGAIKGKYAEERY